MQKTAIFGGTFDPIHWGHLLLAETALSQFNLDRVVWVPTNHPPHKLRSSLLKFEHRLEMVRQAIADHPDFTLSTVEAKRSGPSYTIDTFIELQSFYSNSQNQASSSSNRWYWILGLDAFQSLPKWHRIDELAPRCLWLVAPRLEVIVSADSNNHSKQNSLNFQIDAYCQYVVQQMVEQGIKIQWQCLLMPGVAISSKLVRQYCRDRYSIRYLVPEKVRTYIHTHNLYQSDQSPVN